MKSDFLVKEIAHVQKSIDIARGRGITLSRIMEHDMLSSNTMFQDDLTAKPDKAKLVNELEKELTSANLDFSYASTHETVLLIDLMSVVRRMPLAEMKIFADLFRATWNKIKNICAFQRLDVVFDSYIEKSIKEGERKRRISVQPLEFAKIDMKTTIPVQLDRFWASANYKEMVQVMSRSYLSEVAIEKSVNMILSGYIGGNNETVSCIELKNGYRTQLNDLNSNIEEADLRLVPHIQHAIEQGKQRVVIASNDTDVFALVLYYTEKFLTDGAKEIWLMFGVGDRVRFLPMHTFFAKLGALKCKVIFKAHILSGCDITSKIGTKTAALKANPQTYLNKFGEESDLSIHEMSMAERYLIKVLHPKSTSTSFDQLRVEMYLSRKVSYVELPPSSQSLRGHIQRCYFVIKLGMCLLDGTFNLNPCDFGWTDATGFILPQKTLLPLPSYFLVRCGCKKNCTGLCSCVKEETNCTEFCQCKRICANSM